MKSYFTIKWDNGVVRMIDQRALPHTTTYLDFRNPAEVAEAIRDMVIRGAPALGAAAGYGMALAAQNSKAETADELRSELRGAALTLRVARPTAVNLSWGVERVLRRAAD